MRHAAVVVVAALVAGCGAGRGSSPAPMGVAAHEQAARADEREAVDHERARRLHARERPEDRYRCVDRSLVEGPFSGGQPIPVQRPCWTEDPAYDHATAARRHREAAARHRELARALVEVERERCAGLGEDELSRGPLSHRRDLLAVVPVRRHGEIVGARIRVRRVAGLDAAWLRRATACHHARAAVMGFSPTFQPDDPLAVPGLAIAVADAPDGVDVILTASAGVHAATILGRSQALLDRAPAAPAHVERR